MISVEDATYLTTEINYNCVYIINFQKKILCIRLPPLKCTYLRDFFMDFQKSGSWEELRTRTIHFRRENTAGGMAFRWHFFGINFFRPAANSVVLSVYRTRSRFPPTCASWATTSQCVKRGETFYIS